MEIDLTDVTLHIDETLSRENRTLIEDKLRALDGVISVHNPDERPHLAVIQYNPTAASSSAILDTVRGEGVHAELIGL